MVNTAICLMGPTATGKTDVAISLCKRFPLEIISVDSALVYRGMDIGTAKPDAETLQQTPHRLIDIRDPEESYSAGDFVRDAHEEIRRILAAGRIPLLVGGTMMYFRSLTEGIANLPSADPIIRAGIDGDADKHGWPALHARLAEVDAAAAARIDPNDSQRIQRALEVFLASGKPMSEWQREGQARPDGEDLRFIKIALQTTMRSALNERIERRLCRMLDIGFLDEIRGLMQRPDLTPDNPSMRAVGYRQFWAHLAGNCTNDEARHRTLVATRQLAKRQRTWLRAESALSSYDPLDSGSIDAISAYLAGELD
jgi:tRNA dimethylallyltransferase